jgi:hypothetical protein
LLPLGGLKIGGDSLVYEDIEMAGTQAQASTPAKWLATLHLWVPAEPVEVLVALINSLIEAAGPTRVGGLEALIAHTDGTTRSGREKFERLRQWSDKMRANPLYWPQIFVRQREVSILILAILNKASRPLNRLEVEQKFRKSRDVPPSGLSQELKEMAKRGEIDRFGAGLYWRKGTAAKPYESQTQQLYRLVHDAPGHRLPNAELALAMGISRKELETLLSQMRKRWRDPPLFERPTGAGVIVVSAESLAVLKRCGRIEDGRRGTFFRVLKEAACAEDVKFTTLHPGRPPVDSERLAQEVQRLKGLKKKQQIVEIEVTAKAVGMSSDHLELMVSPASQVIKNAERNAIQESAKEKWRVDYRILAQNPERLPDRKKLWEEARKVPGLTRQIFRDVISEVGPNKPGPRPGIRAKKP